MNIRNVKNHNWFLKMGGVCDTRNVEINILACEYEIFSLPGEFHFNNSNKIYLRKVERIHFLLNFCKVLSEPQAITFVW